MHGHPPRAAPVPRAARRGDDPLHAFASSAPSRGRRGLTSRVTVMPPKKQTFAADRTDPSEGSRRLSAGEAPPRTGSAHLFRRASSCYERRNPSRVVPAPGDSFRRERGTSHRIGPRFPHRPAKGDALRRRPRCVPPPCPCMIARIAPRSRASGPPLHAAPVPRRTPTLCRRREPAPLLPPATPGMTSQASGAARSNGTKGWLLPPFRTPRSQRPRRLP